jgi:RNA polymerase sigma factor (sigma-70 family)
MDAEEQAGEPDFSQESDEAIVRWVQESPDGHRGLAELMCRHRHWMNLCIHKWGKRAGCLREDIRDAQQEGWFLLAAAAGAFHPSPPGEKRRSFRSFLGFVLKYRFSDIVKRLRRRESHLDRRVEPARALNQLDRGPDPVLRAQWREMKDTLDRGLNGLDARARLVWDKLLAEEPLRKIAADLGMSYQAVRRVRDRVRSHLKHLLSDWSE